MGIEELKKLIEYIENCVVEGVKLDWEKIGQEIADLDKSENKELGTIVAKKVLSALLSIIS